MTKGTHGKVFTFSSVGTVSLGLRGCKVERMVKGDKDDEGEDHGIVGNEATDLSGH